MSSDRTGRSGEASAIGDAVSDRGKWKTAEDKINDETRSGGDWEGVGLERGWDRRDHPKITVGVAMKISLSVERTRRLMVLHSGSVLLKMRK